MNESKWQNARYPDGMLEILRDGSATSERRLRSFACACVRRIWHLLEDEKCQTAVTQAERFVDGLATVDDLRNAREASEVGNDEFVAAAESGDERRNSNAAERAASAAAACANSLEGRADEDDDDAVSVVTFVADTAATALSWSVPVPEQIRVRDSIRNEQAALLRDIFGPLPFRAVHFDPAWRTGTAVSLAEAIYETRALPSGHLDNGRLAVLADMLEDQGCNDQELLGHLRQQGVLHVRGCFVLDILLNRK